MVNPRGFVQKKKNYRNWCSRNWCSLSSAVETLQRRVMTKEVAMLFPDLCIDAFTAGLDEEVNPLTLASLAETNKFNSDKEF